MGADTGAGNVLTVILPWPHHILQPNVRAHWAQKAKHTAQARGDAWALTARGINAGTADERMEVYEAPRLQVTLTLFPPDRRKRDTQNVVAALKAALDGVADALGVDDSRFDIASEMRQPQPGGAVRVTISPKEEA